MQNRQGSCSISRDSLALSRKHTSRSSFFRVKRDSASSWPEGDDAEMSKECSGEDLF